MRESCDVKFGIDIGQFLKLKGSLSSLYKCVVTIERLGFNSIWLPDHAIDPLTTLSFIAANTKKVRLGTGVLIPSHRHPVLWPEGFQPSTTCRGAKSFSDSEPGKA